MRLYKRSLKYEDYIVCLRRSFLWKRGLSYIMSLLSFLLHISLLYFQQRVSEMTRFAILFSATTFGMWSPNTGVYRRCYSTIVYAGMSINRGGGGVVLGSRPPALTCVTCSNRADPANFSGWWAVRRSPRPPWIFGPPKDKNSWRRPCA